MSKERSIVTSKVGTKIRKRLEKMAFSYAVLFEYPLIPTVSHKGIHLAQSGTVYIMGGTFTDAQSGGSNMALGTDYGVRNVLFFNATNLTDTDETVQIDKSSDPTIAIATVTNDDDGEWFAVVVKT